MAGVRQRGKLSFSPNELGDLSFLFFFLELSNDFLSVK